MWNYTQYVLLAYVGLMVTMLVLGIAVFKEGANESQDFTLGV